MNHKSPPPTAPTLRAILIGAILVMLMGVFVAKNEIYERRADLTVYAPPAAGIFVLFILVIAINPLLGKLKSQYKLDPRELMTIYIMMMVSGPLASYGLIQFLLPNMVGNQHFATPENMWKETFGSYIPDWMGPRDTTVIKDFYEGTEMGVPWGSWIGPLVIWSAFALALYFATLCLAVILRKRWVEEEKLTFPTAYVPVEMVSDDSNSLFNYLFRSKLVWSGFLIYAALQTASGVHSYFPAFPTIKLVHINLMPLFVDKPWNAMGGLGLDFYPWVIGLAFMLPTEISFSCWFFFLFTRAENVLSSAMGWRGSSNFGSLARFPDLASQGSGAFLALFFITIWMGKKHIWLVLRKAIDGDSSIDDSAEPLPYRTAVIGFILAILFLMGWCWVAGLSLRVGFLFFSSFLIYMVVFSRIRAETGMTWLKNPHNPVNFMIMPLGTGILGIRNLTVLACLKFHTFDPVGWLMPFEMGGLKLAGEIGLKGKRITVAILVAIVVCIFSASWAGLDTYYKYGADNCEPWRVHSGMWAFTELDSFIGYPRSPDITGLGFVAGGAAFCAFLYFMRLKFFWWPFHPAGYAISNTFSMFWMWGSCLTAWLLKVAILKFWGISIYRRVLLVFVGFILGDLFSMAFWSLASQIFHLYGFAGFPH